MPLSTPLHASVRTHRWSGYRYESRMVHTTAPELAPVLLLGGAFQRKESWGRVEPALLANMDVITVDPPGCGAADPLPETHGVDLLADAVCHMLDEIGTHRVNLVGSSYGGAIAYRISQKYPDRVGRVALVSTMTAISEQADAVIRRGLEYLAAGRMDDFALAVLDLLMSRDRLDSIVNGTRARLALSRRLSALSETEIEQTHTNALRMLIHRGSGSSPSPQPPTLIITGEHDALTTPDLCRGLAATCADSWFAQFSNADHMLFMERTTEVTDLIKRFLADEPMCRLPYDCSIERVSPAPDLEGAAARSEADSVEVHARGAHLLV